MHWILSNFRKRIAFATRNPAYAVKALFREVSLSDERFLSKITGRRATQIRAFLHEPLQTPEFAACLRASQAEMTNVGVYSADLYAKKILLQYAAIRALQPDRIVETGVANGVSSAYLLLALEKNGHGTLHSVEIGDTSYLPAGKATGWIVPEKLRHRWDFRIGDSKKILPELLQTLPHIDVFIHDSLHTYEHMLWEFRTAFPFVRAGGLVFSDDALWNNAFTDFAREADAHYSAIIRGVGFLQIKRRVSTPS